MEKLASFKALIFDLFGGRMEGDFQHQAKQLIVNGCATKRRPASWSGACSFSA
jgi:hypothetical protein